MIKASELRTGNHVLYKPYGNRDGQRVTIAGILGMKAYFNKYTNESGMLHALMPIALTPEILEKCGFEIFQIPDPQYKGEEVYHKDPMGRTRLMWSDYEKRACFCTDRFQELSHRVFFGTSYRFLHQLQNAFIILYGEELEIKL